MQRKSNFIRAVKRNIFPFKNFNAVKAESKANFEENRGRNTFAKAKADAKKSWDDAHMSPSERSAKLREENAAKAMAAEKRTEEANARYEAAKKK